MEKELNAIYATSALELFNAESKEFNILNYQITIFDDYIRIEAVIEEDSKGNKFLCKEYHFQTLKNSLENKLSEIINKINL